MRAEMLERVEVAAGVTLCTDPGGRLRVQRDGKDPVEVWPVRCFPLSDPGGAVSLLDSDGHEVAFIARLERLDERARGFVQRELERREFVPVITQVRSISPASEPNTWEVQTDRGATSFTLSAEADVRRLGAHGLLVVDSRGLRFLIPDVRRLDRKSRGWLAAYR